MTTYIEYGVTLTPNQKSKLMSAIRNKSPLTLQLKHSHLRGSDELMLTRRQIARIKKSLANGTGSDIKISRTQIRRSVKHGGSLFTTLGSLASLGAKRLPYAMRGVSKVAPALATGAASALGEIGLKKLFGKGGTKGGSITIPRKFILMLPPFAKEFTKAQRDQINKVYKTGGRLVIKPTRKQIEGGFLGTLASIGIPMAISLVSKMFGSGLPAGAGLQVDRGSSSNTRNVYVPPVTQGKGRHFSGYTPVPHRPPPFLGTWEDMENKGPLGMGVVAKGGVVKSKKKKAQRQGTARRGGSTTRKKQPIQLNSHSRKHFVMGGVPPPKTPLPTSFIIKPLSNFDLMEWVKKLGIKHLRGIYSRDELPRKIKKECGIINLDDIQGPGTHWVCYRNIDSVVEYFDPFGLIMSNEAMKYFNTSGKQIVYSIDEIQNRNTVLCGYWCLYYL